MATIIENANKLIERIREDQKKNFFLAPIIVFDNIYIEQWFKAYFLSITSKLYMNIKCIRFNDLYEMISKSCNILDSNTLKKEIISILVETSNKPDYILDDSKEINQTRLYDYAKKLSEVYTSYNNELFDLENIKIQDKDKRIEKIVSDIAKTEIDIYKKIKEKYGLFSEIEIVKEIKSSVYIFITRALSKLEKKVIDDYNNKYNNKINVYSISETNNASPKTYLSSAPNTLREIEVLHSKICKIINSENDDKTKIKVRDIVVYSPNLDDYIDDISRVFKQSENKYPFVPYVIKTKVNSSALDAISIIYNIIKDGYCTRFSFISLISNGLVMKTNELCDIDVNTIINVIIDTNTYRNSQRKESAFDDWDYLKKRIILSKFVGEDAVLDNIVELGSEKFIPFSNIGLNDELKTKFIDLINIVLRINEIKLSSTLNDKYNEFLNIILDLFKNDLSTASLKMITKEIRSFENTKLSASNNVTIETLLNSVIDSCSISRISGLPFTGGVTFMSLDEKNIVNAKHTFLIGFSSKNYPRGTKPDALNLNKTKKTVTQIDKEVFNIINNNTDNLYVSYVNQDLKSSEEFYVSNLINKDELNEERVTLDELRLNEDLFTKREIENKEFYRKLIGYVDEEKTDEVASKNDYASVAILPITHQARPKVVSASKIKSFLEEPLKAKSELLFGIYNDETIEKISEEYEPFAPDSLDKSKIAKAITIDMINNVSNNEQKEVYELTHVIRDYEYSSTVMDELNKNSKKINEELKKNYVIAKTKPLALILKQDGKDDISWELDSNYDYAVSENGESISYANLRMESNSNDKSFIELYLISLIDIASRCDDTKYNVELKHFSLDKASIKTYELDSSQAKEILNKSYDLLTDYTCNMFVNVWGDNRDVESKYDLISNVNHEKDNHGLWDFYSDKNLFDITNVSSNNDFGDGYTSYYDKINSLTKLLRKEKDIK